jgi:aminocarboxymuconate-semialdehyde decarboxylase
VYLLSDGNPLPQWTEEGHLKMMEENGIDTCILSAPAIHFTKGKQLVELAKSFNQTAYDIKTKNPGRFGAFTTLPLPDVNATLNEISEGLDVLNLKVLLCLLTIMVYTWEINGLMPCLMN